MSLKIALAKAGLAIEGKAVRADVPDKDLHSKIRGNFTSAFNKPGRRYDYTRPYFVPGKSALDTNLQPVVVTSNVLTDPRSLDGLYALITDEVPLRGR